MIRYLKLMWLFARVSVQDDAAYRVDFATRVVFSALQVCGELVTIWTIFSNTTSLGGWNVYEVLTLLGVFRVMTGVIAMLIAPNMRLLMEDIRDGKLDYAIVKPVNTQFFVSVRRFVMWRVTDIVLGFGLVTFAGMRLASDLSPGQVLLFAVMLGAGITIVYSFWLALGTCAFWLTRITNIEVVFWSVFEAGRYPVHIYPPWIRYGLTYLIPLAFLTTIPAGSLVGRADPVSVGTGVVAAAVSLAAASAFWRFGLSRYSGASA